jgi:hypothetical protein
MTRDTCGSPANAGFVATSKDGVKLAGVKGITEYVAALRRVPAASACLVPQAVTKLRIELWVEDQIIASSGAPSLGGDALREVSWDIPHTAASSARWWTMPPPRLGTS